MNVDGDESRRRLNYYSRSSPKRQKGHAPQPLRSPLLPPPPPQPPRSHRHPTPHSRSRPLTPHSSFRLSLMEVSHSSSGEILIEDAGEEEILIEDGEEDEQSDGRAAEVGSFRVEESQAEREEGGLERGESRRKIDDIRI
jgi:hypothetical protein